MSAGNARPRKRAGHPVLIILALTALVLLLGVTAWLLIQEPAPLQEQRLPDGSVIRLEAVSGGREHRYVGGARWKRLVGPRLPARLPDRMGWRVHAYRSRQPDTLVFWTARRVPPATSAGHLRSAIFDEHGCHMEAFTVHQGIDLLEGSVIEAYALPAYPLRGPVIGLRIGLPAGGAGITPPAEFRLPNPTPRSYPRWKAEPLPIAHRDGDKAFALTELTAGLDGPGPSLRPAAPGAVTWSRASFRVAEAGRPSDGWTVAGLTLSDATGNMVEPDASSQYQHEGQAHFALQGGLCIEEPAWKMRVEFARQKGFQPGELWTVRDVPITRRGTPADPSARFTRHGVTLRLLGITAAGAQPPPDGVIMGDGTTVYVQAPSSIEGLQFTLVRAADDQGRSVAGTRSIVSGSGVHGFGLQAARDARALDLTFALQRSRFAEFVARPTRLSVRVDRGQSP